MKKTMILAAAAAMFMFSSCQKEEVAPDQNSLADELVFTATIDQSSTKTTVNTDASSASRGKVSWESDDVITITAAGKTAVYEIEKIDGDVATFKKKSGDDLPASGVTYTATYGVDPTAAQTYSSSVTDLPMSAASTTTNFSFQVTCGLLKLNLKASDASDKKIKKIEVFGTPAGGSFTAYTLSCSTAQDASSAKDFYIALPAGNYKVMKFTNSTGHICFKTATSAMAIEANKIQPVTLTGIVFNDMLPGKFTVNSSGKQVRFSRGNLYWDGSAYHFESSQTAYPTSWSTKYVGHFFWTNTSDYKTSGKEPYAASYSFSTQSNYDSFCFGEGNKANTTVDGHNNLYVLSGGPDGEWDYLINGRGSNLYKHYVTVNNAANCLVIAPDGYTGTIALSYDAATWATAEALGFVCLPPAGYRYYDEGTIKLDSQGSQGAQNSHGFYWSASPEADEEEWYEDCAYCLEFYYGGVSSPDNARDDGLAIRLVSTVAK